MIEHAELHSPVLAAKVEALEIEVVKCRVAGVEKGRRHV